MIKRFALAYFIALLAASGAHAADVALPTKAPAPVIYGDPWNGFYIGGNIGYGLDRGASTACCNASSFAVDFATAPAGLVGGLHAGYMYHLPGSGFVLGIEGDGDLATLDGTVNNPGFIGNANSKNRWLASFRGRLGYLLVPNVLVYGTGGWGWGSSDFTVQAVNANGTFNAMSLSATKNGAVVGGGIDFAITANWIAGLEYLHFFLNDSTANMGGGNFLTASDNVDMVRARLSYKF
jgi:outer membrane immunogenic protein